jgi:hypothetical protein
MKKFVFVVIIALITWTPLRSQDQINFTRTNLFFELGGPAFFSGNIERLFNMSNSLKLVGRTGIGTFPYQLGIGSSRSKYTAIIPLTTSFIYGKKFSFEAGFGLSIGWGDDAKGAFGEAKGPIRWYNGMLGFRYQKPNKGFLFRLGYTPWITPSRSHSLDSNNTIHLIGLSLGGRLIRR